ncbi:EpsG family protein [Limosilactobacillus fermentum]|uniref:EpsG family protein n=1 Tax=Limosilactobacillus fermentum TaxID=1613 RepID=UPI00370979F0
MINSRNSIYTNILDLTQERKLPYLICAISPLAAMMMFHSRYIGNDSLKYYNLFLQTSRATVQDLLTNTRFEHGYLLLNWLIGRFTGNPQWLYICIGTFMSIALIWWVYRECQEW